MPIIELRRLPRFVAAQAAIVGTARAMEMAFPVIRDEAVRNRIGMALAALFAAETLAGRA